MNFDTENDNNIIIKGSTPLIRYNFNIINPAELTVCYLVIRQRDINIIEKGLEQATVAEKYIDWYLTQEEALKIDPKAEIEVQIRYKTNTGAVSASPITEVKGYEILKDGVI